ncbi:MAG: hypothetical protein D4R84_07580 [Rhodocyclaceae bacterium]|nr:MAG: hypothetical protein D4R84_07580 [Rhodocyclaceae bacterium]
MRRIPVNAVAPFVDTARLMPVAVPPAPTFAALAMVRQFRRKVAWLIALATVAGFGLVPIQTIARAGEVQPFAATADIMRMEERWREIQTTLRPSRLIVLCQEFTRDYPISQFLQRVQTIQAGASHALDIQRSVGLSGDFFDDAVGDSGYRDYLLKTLHGDKDAAYRIAVAFKEGALGVVASSRRTEQWLRFSAELGNGVASWELAENYNHSGFMADAARFEKRALELGYQPPVRLANRGY